MINELVTQKLKQLVEGGEGAESEVGMGDSLE